MRCLSRTTRFSPFLIHRCFAMTKLMSLLALTVLFPLSAAAQTIPIKTVPVAEGGQFLLFPSQNLGMGGVAIALDDPLLDPFVNPAKAINTEGIRFASAPVYYGFTEGNGMPETGSGRTLPVGGRGAAGQRLQWCLHCLAGTSRAAAAGRIHASRLCGLNHGRHRGRRGALARQRVPLRHDGPADSRLQPVGGRERVWGQLERDGGVCASSTKAARTSGRRARWGSTASASTTPGPEAGLPNCSWRTIASR